MSMKTGIESVRRIKLPRFTDGGGSLSVLEGGLSIPFEIRRVYYLYDMQQGERRGGHAHKNHEEVVFPVAGGFDIFLDDGTSRKMFQMNEPNVGLYYPHMVWHELSDFVPGTVCLVMASQHYDEEDYFREYEVFLQAARQGVSR